MWGLTWASPRAQHRCGHNPRQSLRGIIPAEPNHRLVTLLLVSTMTAMAGATIAPGLPAIRASFSGVHNADLLVRLVLTMPALFTAVGAPVAGLLIDRFGRRRLLLAAMCLYGVGGAAGGLVSSIWLLLASRALLGLAVGGVMTTATTLIADYYTGEERGTVMGHQAAFMSFGGIVFILLGGLLADLSWRAPFAIYLLAFLYLPMAIAYLHEPRADAAAANRPGAMPRPGSRSFQQMPWVLIACLCGLAMLVMLVFYMTPVQVPFYLERLGIRSGTLVGVALSATTVTGALASMRYGRVKAHVGYHGVFAIGFALMGVGNAVVAIADGFGSVVAGLAILGSALGLLMPNLTNWAGEVAPEGSRGRVLSGVTTFLFLGQFLSPIATQPLVDSIGLSATFGVAAGVVGAVAILFAGWSIRAPRPEPA